MNKTFIALCSLFIACKANSERVDQIKENLVETDTKERQEALFAEPINIGAIKQLGFITTTSGVVPIAEAESFCQQQNEGFYGFYHLINKTNNQMIGVLTIFTTDQPQDWKVTSKRESLFRIKLETNDIQVWDSISVGMNENNLSDFIGDHFHYKKGTTMYAELGDYKSNFTINSDTISRIEITRSCE